MLITNSKTKNTSRSIIWGFIGKIVAIVLPFMVRTVIIYFLGIEYTGLNSLFTSILSVLSFAELGVGSALLSSMYKPVSDNDIEKVNAYLNLYRRCYRIIGSIILIAGLVLMPFLPKLINGIYPADINIYILYGIYLVNTVLSYFMFSYKNSILIATQRNDIISKVGIVILIATDVVQLILLLLFKNYYLYVIIMPIMTIANNLMIALISKKLYPEVFAKGEVDKEDVRAIFIKLKGLVFQQIGGIILSSADTIVISAYLGLRLLGMYNNYYFIINALFGFFAVIQTSLYPSIGNSLHTDTVEKNYSDFKFFHFLYILCDIFCATCLLSLFQPFIKLWVGESMMLEMPLVILLVVYFYTFKMSDICSIYRFAAGIFEKWKYVPFIAGVTNLTLNLYLTKIIGLYGIVLSTIFALVFIYLPFYCYPIIKHCFKNTKYFWDFIRRQFVYMSVSIGVAFSVFKITSFITGDGLISFEIKVFSTVSLSCLFLGMIVLVSPYKKRSCEFLKKILKR